MERFRKALKTLASFLTTLTLVEDGQSRVEAEAGGETGTGEGGRTGEEEKGLK